MKINARKGQEKQWEAMLEDGLGKEEGRSK